MRNILNYIPIPLPAPTVRMRRMYNREHYCISCLYLNNEYLCDAIEDTVRDHDHNGKIDHDEEKIYGETAIPCGRYYVTFCHTSLAIGKKARHGCIPYVHKVPSFEHIRIHPGVDERNSEGCIILGYNKEVGKVLDSEACCLMLYDRMHYRPFWLVITDDFAQGEDRKQEQQGNDRPQ